MEIIRIEQTPSTNDLLKQLIAERSLGEGTVVIARAQTKGRGQINNSWEAEPGMNLTFSLLLRPEMVRPSDQFVISQAVSLGMIDLLTQIDPDFRVKWPNDIYWREKKVAGILIENNLIGNRIDSCVVGVGLNVNQTCFVSNAPNPVSLFLIADRLFDLDILFVDLFKSIDSRYMMIGSSDEGALRSDYLQQLFRVNEAADYKDCNGMFRGMIKDVLPSGHLLIEDSLGALRRYSFKEVEFLHKKELPTLYPLH